MSKSSTSSSGITFLQAMTLILFALKLTNNIDWHWIWVMMPMLAEFTLLGSLALILIIHGVRKDREARDAKIWISQQTAALAGRWSNKKD